MTLQKLSRKSLLKMETKRSTGQITITFLPAAAPILSELSAAQSNYEQTFFEGFTEEELIQYAHLNEKAKRNIQKFL